VVAWLCVHSERHLPKAIYINLIGAYFCLDKQVLRGKLRGKMKFRKSKKKMLSTDASKYSIMLSDVRNKRKFKKETSNCVV